VRTNRELRDGRKRQVRIKNGGRRTRKNREKLKKIK
jgi:hypothetical protein